MGKARNQKPGPFWRPTFGLYAGAAFVVALLGFMVFLPSIIVTTQPQNAGAPPFPVTVDPRNKLIMQDANVDAMLAGKNRPLASAAAFAGNVFRDLAAAVVESAPYQAVDIAKTQIVTVQPGWRKEQVADAFAKVLHWDTTEKNQFLDIASTLPPTLEEGEYAPGTYVVHASTTPTEVQAMIRNQFDQDIALRYTKSVDSVVPMDQALTIASMIERETSDPAEMRIISGIMWNRLFKNMRLQIDSTVQYAVAGNGSRGWWPVLRHADLVTPSPYNTYVNTGIPPAAISNPSVAAVIAALNPVQTDCLYYFHDDNGDFHCSNTYQEHVALLKQYYGRGR